MINKTSVTWKRQNCFQNHRKGRCICPQIYDHQIVSNDFKIFCILIKSSEMVRSLRLSQKTFKLEVCQLHHFKLDSLLILYKTKILPVGTPIPTYHQIQAQIGISNLQYIKIVVTMHLKKLKFQKTDKPKLL